MASRWIWVYFSRFPLLGGEAAVSLPLQQQGPSQSIPPMFFAQLFYLHGPTLGLFFKRLFTPRFRLSRMLFGLLIFLALLLVSLLVLIGRLLDEVFFFGYRRFRIEQPLFIVSNPRSGTTLTHRLLSLDEERYASLLLYHTVFPSVTLIKLFKLLYRIDGFIFHPLTRLVLAVDRWAFKGWQHIHPTGMLQTEEDEGIFTTSWLTPGLLLFTPFATDFQHLNIPDNMPERKRRRWQAYYVSSLKRILYAQGAQNRVFLSKNVLTLGRFKTLVEAFPDLRMIYIARSPLNTVPSYVSMFTKPWPIHSPDFVEDTTQLRALGQTIIDHYHYHLGNRKTLPPERYLELQYKDLVADPQAAVLSIYAHFGIPVTEAFEQALTAETTKARAYKSKHKYTLEQFGFSEEELRERMAEVFDTWDY